MKILRQLPILVGVVALIAAAVFVTVNVIAAGSPPDGPADVLWDREVCAHCRMHIGEPAFAAQVQTADGRVLNFDDPGCAFAHLEDARGEVRAIYFRHHREDRWLSADRTAFVAVAQSPMGFGYGATDPGTAGSIPLAQARARMLRRN